MKCFLFSLVLAVSAFAQVSPFPGSNDTNATLGVGADNVSSALTSAMLIGDTVAHVANEVNIPQWSLITWGTGTGAELDQVCLVSGNTLTFGTRTACPSILGRGLSGTTVAPHNIGVTGSLNSNAWYQQAAASAIVAIENTYTGPNGAADVGFTNAAGQTTTVAAALLGAAPLPLSAPTYFQHLRNCVARVNASTGSTQSSECRILFLGDSTTFGYDSPFSGSMTQAFMRRMNSYGFIASESSFIGDGSATTRSSVNPQVSVTGGWTPGNNTLGGSVLSTAATGTVTLTPQSHADYFRVFFVTCSACGIATVSFTTGGSVSVNTYAATNGILEQDYSTAGAFDAGLQISYSSGGAVNLLGIEAAATGIYNEFIIDNAGVPGATSASLLQVFTSGWGLTSMLPVLAPDLIVIDLDLNDGPDAIALGTYIANMQALITAAKAQSDVLIVTSQHGNGTFADAVVGPYVAAVKTLSLINGVGLLDYWTTAVSYAQQVTNGWNADALVHYNAKGNADIGGAIFNFLAPMLVSSLPNGAPPIQHLGGIGPTPAITFGAGAGTGAVSNTSRATDLNGNICLTTGSAPAASNTLLTIAYANAYVAPFPDLVISPSNAAAAALSGAASIYFDGTNSTLSLAYIKTGSTALAAATQYCWGWHVAH